LSQIYSSGDKSGDVQVMSFSAGPAKYRMVKITRNKSTLLRSFVHNNHKATNYCQNPLEISLLFNYIFSFGGSFSCEIFRTKAPPDASFVIPSKY
jgi:hypothetical protein